MVFRGHLCPIKAVELGTQVRKLEGHQFTMTRQQNPVSVDVGDAAALPFTFRRVHYDIVPAQLQEKIIEKAKSERGEVKDEEE